MSGSCQLLPGESPRCFQPTMVRVLGLDDAILVQQVHHRLQYPDAIVDGVPYIRASYAHLGNIVGTGWSESTLKRKVKAAVHDPQKGYLIQRHGLDGNLADRTCWYTLDYGRLEALVGIPGLLSQHNVNVDPGVMSDWHDEPLKSEAQDPDPDPRRPDVLRPARGQSGTSPDPRTLSGSDPASAPALSAVATAQKPTESAEEGESPAPEQPTVSVHLPCAEPVARPELPAKPLAAPREVSTAAAWEVPPAAEEKVRQKQRQCKHAASERGTVEVSEGFVTCHGCYAFVAKAGRKERANGCADFSGKFFLQGDRGNG